MTAIDKSIKSHNICCPIMTSTAPITLSDRKAQLRYLAITQIYWFVYLLVMHPRIAYSFIWHCKIWNYLLTYNYIDAATRSNYSYKLPDTADKSTLWSKESGWRWWNLAIIRRDLAKSKQTKWRPIRQLTKLKRRWARSALQTLSAHSLTRTALRSKTAICTYV